MRHLCISIIILLVSNAACISVGNPNAFIVSANSAEAVKAKADLWLSTQNEKGFLENRGQMTDMNGNSVPDVFFKTEAPNLNFWITQKGITLQTRHWRGEPKRESELTIQDMEEEIKTGKGRTNKFLDWERIDIELKGAIILKENILKENPLQGASNFFYSNCPDGIYGVKEYERVTIKNVYPGIDWVLYRKSDGSLKYDFVVHPGADYLQIELLYISKTPIGINEQGQLELFTNYGNVKENTPLSFYDGKELNTRFVKAAPKRIYMNGEVGYETSVRFKISAAGNWSRNDEILTIDPQLFWASFYGGNNAEGGWSLTTDACGNLFEAGYVESSSFFPVLNAGTYFQGSNAGGWDAFILKFDNTGVPIWATYYGGSSGEFGQAIAIDPSGNVWVTGFTLSTDFPVQNAGTFYQATNAGSNDFFILKFDNNGNRILATYYGGSAAEVGNSITTDAAGNVFITGDTQSGNCPTQNPFQAANGGTRDAFIMKFDNAGNRLWATYYGGSGDEESYAIVTDATGNVWVTGTTYSGNFPTQTAGTFFQGTNAGSNDAYILKFDNAGNRLMATFYGGNGGDKGYGLAVDAAGNIFVLGVSQSSNFPVQNAGTYYDATLGGVSDAVILKFDNAGNRLWGTYYGGTGLDYYGLLTTDNIAIDPCGNVYISFETSGGITTLAPCDAGYYDNSFNGGDSNPTDIFLSLFDNSGVLLWATYFGGDGNDFRSPITLDVNGNLFLAGEWSKVSGNASYPLTNPASGQYYDPTFNGNFDDAFIAKFCSHTCICSSYLGCTVSTVLTVSVTSTNPVCNAPCTGTANAISTGGCTASTYTFSWSTTPIQTTQTATGLCAGVYTVTVTNSGGSTATATVNITQPTSLTVSATATAQTCTQLGTATAIASLGTSPFTYQWCNGATTSSTTGLAAGSCTVIVTDANGCANTATVTIAPPASITVSTTATSQTCAQLGSATASISSGTAPYTFQWCNGATTSSTTGLAAGSCTVIVTDANGCIAVNTVSVGINGNVPTSTVTATSAACGLNNGTASVTVNGGTPTYTYSWSTVPIQTTQSATGLAAGNYSVIITDANGCTTASTVSVSSSSPPVASAASATVCSGQGAVLTASGGTNYLWSNGATTSSIIVSSAGTYTVIVSTGSCSDTATGTVVINPSPTAGITPGITITQGQSVTLDATGGGTYLWSNTSTDSTIIVSPNATSIYCVYVTNGYNCVDTICTTVTVEPIDCSTAGELYLPNAFSPNGDNENETFGLHYGNYECIKTYLLIIYNRWGEKVFETSNPAFRWDGYYNGKMETTSVFTYYMRTTLINGEEVTGKGNVSIVR